MLTIALMVLMIPALVFAADNTSGAVITGESSTGNQLIFQILMYAITAYGGVVAVFLIKLLVKGAKLLHINITDKEVTKAVLAAEQVIGSGSSADKKQYVVDTLSKKIGGKLSSAELDQLIEAAVYNVSKAIKSSASCGATIIEKPAFGNDTGSAAETPDGTPTENTTDDSLQTDASLNEIPT